MNTNMEKHIVNSMTMTNMETEGEQVAVQIEQSSLELLLQTYQNLQSFYVHFNQMNGI